MKGQGATPFRRLGSSDHFDCQEVSKELTAQGGSWPCCIGGLLNMHYKYLILLQITVLPLWLAWKLLVYAATGN